MYNGDKDGIACWAAPACLFPVDYRQMSKRSSKHLVGGLHTVYTKLKRLEITPIVCNVEQVRILRGLGAIQPGVNRCKLLGDNDFDMLYKDCTTSR